MKMPSRSAIIALLLVLGLISSSYAQGESITISTYYPSPFGVYRVLRLFPGGRPPGVCERGSLYYHDGSAGLVEGLYVCVDDGAGSFRWEIYGGFWSAANVNDIHNTNLGNVGIGTTNPNAGHLHIDSGANDIDDIYITTAVFPNIAFNDPSHGSNWEIGIDAVGDNDFEIRDANQAVSVHRLVIDGVGNVGVGTSTPQNRLDVEGSAVIGATYSGTNTAQANGLLVEGKVGIGTTNPTCLLHVVSTAPGGVLGSIGIWGQSPDSSGVRGSSTNGDGVQGISWTGIGVEGSTTSGPYGVLGINTNAAGEGVRGSGNTGVRGQGGNYGVYAYSPSGTGVYAYGTSVGVEAVTTDGYGVRGFSNSDYGVWGQSNGAAAVIGTGPTGVQGVGGTYGVYGSGTYGVYGAGTTYDFLGAGGEYADSSGWNDSSDRNLKENFVPVDEKIILNKISQLPITKWNYKRDTKKTRHIGPMGQDFYALFNVGSDDKHTSSIDRSGVALAGIKALNEKLEKQTEEIKSLKAEIASLKQLIKENKI